MAATNSGNLQATKFYTSSLQGSKSIPLPACKKTPTQWDYQPSHISSVWTGAILTWEERNSLLNSQKTWLLNHSSTPTSSLQTPRCCGRHLWEGPWGRLIGGMTNAAKLMLSNLSAFCVQFASSNNRFLVFMFSFDKLKGVGFMILLWVANKKSYILQP